MNKDELIRYIIEQWVNKGYIILNGASLPAPQSQQPYPLEEKQAL